MKNSQKGFIIPILLAIVVILVVVGGYYIYSKNKNTITIPIYEQNNNVSTSTDENVNLPVVSNPEVINQKPVQPTPENDVSELPIPVEQENPNVPVASNPETVYCDWSGKVSIVAPGMNEHAYKYCKLDFSKVASGANIKLNVQNGGGVSKASVDLFPAGAVILSSGRQTDSICHIYDLSSNASDYAICPITQPGIYTLGMEGNWFSTLNSTNEITYKISILVN
jgi:hypothetical protein